MPLQTVGTPFYIKRTRIFVNSKDKIPGESRSEFYYTVSIRGDIKDVVSIELVDWNLSNLYSPTFIGRYNSLLPGKYYPGPVIDELGVNDRESYGAVSKFDIRIQDETLTDEIILTVDMAEYLFPQSLAGVQYRTRQALVDAVSAAIAYHFEKLGVTNPIINYTNTSFTVGLDDAGHLQIYFFRTIGNAPMPCYFLFATGPSVSESAPRPLGFLPGVDTTLPPLTDSGVVGLQYILTSPNLVNLIPFRYIDISVDEANIKPIARVFFQSPQATDSSVGGPGVDPTYLQPFDKGLNSRLLTDPIDKMDRITVKLELPGGRDPSFYGDASHQLTFELLSVVPAQQCSNWLTQKFQF